MPTSSPGSWPARSIGLEDQPGSRPRSRSGPGRSRPRRRRGREPAVVQQLLQRVVHLGADLQRLGEAAPRRTGTSMNSCRSIVLSACAPPLITFISGTGSTCAFVAADVAVQAEPELVGGGACATASEVAEDRVRAEPALVVVPSSSIRMLVDRALVLGQLALERAGRSRRSRCAPPACTPLPPNAALAVAQLDRLVHAGRGAGGDGGASHARRTRAAPRPRRSGCRASRGSGARGRLDGAHAGAFLGVKGSGLRTRVARRLAAELALAA